MDVDQIISRIEDNCQPVPSLSGQAGQEGEENDSLAARIDHLNAGVQGAIREMSDIQHKYPIRAFETEDFYRAGIVCSPGVQEKYPGVVKRFSGLFFGEHHAAICRVFGPELQAVARKYGKTSGERHGDYGNDSV